MKPSKAAKSFEIISDNPKMDTSGMAGKPVPMDMYMTQWKPPVMTIGDMMEVRERKQAKKPEMDE